MSLLQGIIECKKDQNLNKIWGKHKCYYVIEIKTFYNFTSLWFHSLGYLTSAVATVLHNYYLQSSAYFQAANSQSVLCERLITSSVMNERLSWYLDRG